MFGSMNIINLVNIRSMRSRTGRTFMTGRRTRQLTRKLQNAVNSKMRVGWTYPPISSLQGKWSQGGSPGPLPCPQWAIHSQSDSAAGYPHRSRHDLLMLFPLPPDSRPVSWGCKISPLPLLQSEPGLLWLWGDITNAENCQKCRQDGKWHIWYFLWRKKNQF